MGRLARDECSGLLQKIVTYGGKSFITLAPGVISTNLWRIETVMAIILFEK
jgi:hypothetical protein